MSTLLFLKEVLIATLTSFGGQGGHLLTFIKRFSVKSPFYTKEEILNFHSFCSILPGPTSTQLLCLIAYNKGGLLLCFLSLLIWITPVSILMFSLALLFYDYDIIFHADKLFVFFQPMIIVFMFTAGLKIRNRYPVGPENTLILLITTIIFLLFFKHPFIIPFIFLINGIYTHKRSNRNFGSLFSISFTDIKINKKLLTLLLSVLIFSAISSEYSRKFDTKNRYIFNLIEHNIRHGSIIYGGGDVLIPMMYEQYITRPTAKIIKKRNPEALTIKKSELMAGAGLIRLMPGPVFSLVAFTTPLIVSDYDFEKKSLTTFLALFSIYLPGILIILILFPVWNKVSLSQAHLQFLKGISLSVSALIFASCLYLSIDLLRNNQNGFLLINQLLMAIVIFQVLKKFEINHALIAILCFLFGTVYHIL